MANLSLEGFLDFSSHFTDPMIDEFYIYEQPAVEMPNTSLSNPTTFTDLANSCMDFIEEDLDSLLLGNDVNRECSNVGNEISVDNTPELKIAEEAPIDQDQAVTDLLSNFISPPESIASTDTCSTPTYSIPAKIEVIEEAPIDQDQAVTDLLSNFISPESIASTDMCSAVSYSIPALETDANTLELYFQDLLDLLAVDPAATVREKCVPVDVTIETSAEKRKCISTNEQPPTKRAKPTDNENPEVAILDKARHTRIKNKIACRNTRAARRQREEELFVQAEQEEKSNAELRLQVDMLTKEIEAVRKTLAHRLNDSP